MIVVDTNIIGYLYLTSDRSAQAEQALLKDPAWAAPLPWRSELRNVLARYIRNQWNNLSPPTSQFLEESLPDKTKGIKKTYEARLIIHIGFFILCPAIPCRRRTERAG